MIGVFDAGETIPKESPLAVALNTVQGTAANFCFNHVLPPMSSESEAAVAGLVKSGLVAIMVERLVALKKLKGEEGTLWEG